MRPTLGEALTLLNEAAAGESGALGRLAGDLRELYAELDGDRERPGPTLTDPVYVLEALWQLQAGDKLPALVRAMFPGRTPDYLAQWDRVAAIGFQALWHSFDAQNRATFLGAVLNAGEYRHQTNRRLLLAQWRALQLDVDQIKRRLACIARVSARHDTSHGCPADDCLRCFPGDVVAELYRFTKDVHTEGDVGPNPDWEEPSTDGRGPG